MVWGVCVCVCGDGHDVCDFEKKECVHIYRLFSK